MSAISLEAREAFFDAVRTEAVQFIYGYWSTNREPIGIERATKQIQIRIIKKLDRRLPYDDRWHFAKLPDELTIRRRINEAADPRRYAGEAPLVCIGFHVYQGERESQYLPTYAAKEMELVER